MRDGITDLAAILIAALVLIFVPVILKNAVTNIRTEAKAERMMNQAVSEINREEMLTLSEMESLLRVASVQERPAYLVYYGMEGINNGTFGGFIYKVNVKQLYEILSEKGCITLSEGGTVGVYR